MAPALVKSLSRLNRSSLIQLALKWLEQQENYPTYLADNRKTLESEEEDYLFPPAQDVETLQEIYRLLRHEEKLVTKRDIIDRIVDGDWRRGLSLHQLAMIDFAYLEQNDTALKWSALRLEPLDTTGDDPHTTQPAKKRRKLNNLEPTPKYPHITPATFVTALKAEISPLVKAHYHLHRLPPPANLSVLRIYLPPPVAFAPKKSSTPTSTKLAVDASRVMYIAIPNSCPYVYIAVSGSTKISKPVSGKRDNKGRVKAQVDMTMIKKIVLEAIPKAMSRPQERWSIRSTKLTARSLHAISELRGNEKPGTSGGAYSVFVAQDHTKTDCSPIQVIQLPDVDVEQNMDDRSSASTNIPSVGTDVVVEQSARDKQLTLRFGQMTDSYHASLDRVHVKVDDLLQPAHEARPSDDAASISITFSGTDIFRGLKSLASLGDQYIDLAHMPAWMTGELGSSSITV